MDDAPARLVRSGGDRTDLHRLLLINYNLLNLGYENSDHQRA